MKTTNRSGKAGIIILGACCLFTVFAVGESQAAVAKVRASAEVIDPAVIDCSRILANAAAEAVGKPADSAAAQQVQPEVKAVTVDGITWLSIDYN